MIAPVGKSGPFTCRASRSESIVGSSIIATSAETISRRLCGGMLVAIPTAMPAEPLTSRFGNREGRMVVAVDAQRVHRLNAGVVDRRDLGVVIVGRDERLHDCLYLVRLDAL